MVPQASQTSCGKASDLAETLNIVKLPFSPEKQHPLGEKLRLMGCLLSGNPLKTKALRTELKKSCLPLGDQELKNSIPQKMDGFYK